MRYDAVVFDEVQTIRLGDEDEIVCALKGYLESGEFRVMQYKGTADAVVAAGLPAPAKQMSVTDNGYLLTIADLALVNDDVKLLIYVDGLAFHSSMRQRIHDAQQTKRLTEMGYTVLRFPGPRVYHDADGCVGEVGSVLHASKESAR